MSLEYRLLVCFTAFFDVYPYVVLSVFEWVVGDWLTLHQLAQRSMPTNPTEYNLNKRRPRQETNLAREITIGWGGVFSVLRMGSR